MASVVNRDLDMHPLLVGGNYPVGGGFVESFSAGSSVLRGPNIYYDRLDVVIWDWNLSAAPPASGSFCRFDPLFLDNTGSLFTATYEPGSISGNTCNELAVGHWNRLTNEQKVYAFTHVGTGAGKPFHEVSPLSLNVVNQLDVWPMVGQHSARNTLIAGDPYFYTAMAGTWRFFEDYGKGYCVGRWYDSTGTIKDRVLMEVDLTTGLADVVLCPMYYGTGTVHEYTEAQLYAQNVYFTGMQFVHDDDDTPDEPKGQMYFWSDMNTDPDDALKLRMWYKIVDWNPTGKSGVPNRVHLRERLLSAVSVIKSAHATSPDGVFIGAGGFPFNWIYHPRSNLMFFSDNVGTGPSLDAGEAKLLYVAPSAVFSHITNPYAMSTISTGKTTAFAVDALGSLQEPITGVDVEWSLANESTVDEVLATTATPGETVTLANTVEPQDAAVSPIVVKKDGVVMTEGGGAGEYSLSRATSQITFNAPETVAAVYTATYRHWDDSQASPHGDLLNAVSSSDADGVAIARVRYDEEDPVPDRWDRISAEDV